MRAIYLTDSKQRDTHVAFESVSQENDTQFRLENDDRVFSVKVIKTTFPSSLARIQQMSIDESQEIEELLIKGDPEIDFNYMGKISSTTKTVFVDDSEQIAYHLRFKDVTYDRKGQETIREEHIPSPSNITLEIPLVWTHKYIPLKKLLQSVAVTKIYQIHHVNGLTYDYLFHMAKDLSDRKCAVLIGAGEKGREPLRFQRDGLPYRAFLVGAIDGEAYRLSLHLSNLELKDYVDVD